MKDEIWPDLSDEFVDRTGVHQIALYMEVVMYGSATRGPDRYALPISQLRRDELA
jgi:hypothetical protein